VAARNGGLRRRTHIAHVVPGRWWRHCGPGICHGIADFGCEEVHLDPRVIFAAGHENAAIFEDGGGIVEWRIHGTVLRKRSVGRERRDGVPSAVHVANNPQQSWGFEGEPP
jgi:hypothetical protein